MTNIETWAPTIISCGALAIIFFWLRNGLITHKSEIKEKVTKLEQNEEKIKEEYLTETIHEIKCGEVNAKIQTELTKIRGDIDLLNQTVISRFDRIEDLVK